MKSQTLSNGILDIENHEKWSVSKWGKFISTAYFTDAVILFLFSFLLFFVKRAQGNDPYMVSGAYNGTTQLTYFICVNMLSMIIAVSGYYLYKFSSVNNFKDELKDAVEISDNERLRNREGLSDKEELNDYLRQYFKTIGISTIPLFCLVISGIIYFVLR